MWTDRQLKLLEAGGNDKLSEFLDTLDLKQVDIKLRYQTAGMVWYRKMNEAKALEREFTEP